MQPWSSGCLTEYRRKLSVGLGTADIGVATRPDSALAGSCGARNRPRRTEQADRGLCAVCACVAKIRDGSASAN
jgi:hypothetical protein